MRSATVVAVGKILLLSLSRANFTSIIDDQIHKILVHRMDMQNDSVTLEDLDIVRPLGQGAFGNVVLTNRRDTEVYYALKFINRLKIDRAQLYRYILREKFVLL